MLIAFPPGAPSFESCDANTVFIHLVNPCKRVDTSENVYNQQQMHLFLRPSVFKDHLC